MFSGLEQHGFGVEREGKREEGRGGVQEESHKTTIDYWITENCFLWSHQGRIHF